MHRLFLRDGMSRRNASFCVEDGTNTKDLRSVIPRRRARFSGALLRRKAKCGALFDALSSASPYLPLKGWIP